MLLEAVGNECPREIITPAPQGDVTELGLSIRFHWLTPDWGVSFVWGPSTTLRRAVGSAKLLGPTFKSGHFEPARLTLTFKAPESIRFRGFKRED